MAIHIVTSRCLLSCEKVISVKLDEERIDKTPVVPKIKGKRKPGRPKKTLAPQYRFNVVINYITGSSANYGDSECSLVIALYDQQKAYSLFAEIVREVQEQYPNEVYLDKLVNKMLAGEEFKATQA